MKGCVFAGTFDPVTIGHEEIINECLLRYGKVLVVVGKNPKKTTLFTEDQRLQMLKSTFEGVNGVTVVAYSNLEEDYVGYLKENGYQVYVRGIRDDADLKMEDAMKEENKKIYPFIQTEYLYSTDLNKQVSSSKIRQNIYNNQNFLQDIPQKAQALAQKFVSQLKKD